MKYIFKTCTLLFIITAAVLLIPSLTKSANAQFPCALTICKSAPGAGGQGFLIDFTDSGGTETVELFDGGDCFTTQLNFDADVDVTEQPTPGWRLVDVLCDFSPGFQFTSIQGGIVALCTSQALSETTCTFVNSASENVPTLSEWGMIAAAGGLMLIGVFFAVRQRLQASA